MLGALDQPTVWALQEVGRVLFRVRSLPPAAGPDDWHVLVPESSTTIQAGGKPVQVTFNLAFAGNEDVGANLMIKGPGAQHVELMAFINVGSTTPSWAYVGVVADKEPLPASLTIRATTPVSSLLSSTHSAITAKIDTVDANASLTLRAGRADLPSGAVPATLTAVDLVAALAVLAAHGLNLSGLPVPPTGSTTVTAQAPTADPGPGAFTNAMVPSMTDVSATLTKPDGTSLGTSSWTAAIDLKDGTATAQPSVTTLDWAAGAISNAVVAIASKDAVAKQGLDHRTGILMVNAGSLPKTVHTVLTAMPDIAFGGTSPDPVLAAPAIEYTADSRLASLDVMTVSQATPVNPVPPGGTPAPNTAAKVSAADVPRQVVVRLGQWDPNHPKDGYVDLQLLDENGGPDVLGRLGAATIAAATIPAMLTTGSQQQVRVEGSAGTRAVDLIGLKRITVKTQPRPVTSTQTVASAELHYLAATARAAIVTLIDDDLGTTVITANDLPAEVTGSAQVPDAATLQDATATWSANAHVSAAPGIGTVRVTKSPPPNAAALGHDQVALDITATNFPGDVIVKGENTGATQRTELTWLAPATMSTLTGRADITRYSVPAAPFVSVQGSVEILPRGVALGITRSTAGVDVQYGGSDRIPHADVTVRTTGLITPRPGQHVPFDHATVRVTDIPATGNDPQGVAAGPRLTVLVDTSVSAGLVSHIDVPTGVDPLGIAHVRVVDDRADATDGDTFGTPSGVRWINRPRVAVDDLPGAPVGSLLALTLPQLRAARYDGRNGLSLPSQFLITRGISAGEQAFGVQLSLDETEAVTLELAVDDDKGSTWINGTLSAAQQIAVDGQLAGSSLDGSYLAAEVLPREGTVDAVVQHYDRTPDGAPTFDNSAQGHDAEHLIRSSLARLLVTLPDRLEGRLDCPSSRLDLANGMATTEPAQRRGAQVLGEAAQLLLGPPEGTSRITGWVSGQHGLTEDIARWKEFCQDHTPRAQYEVRRNTTATVIPGQPEPRREVHDVGVGPSTLLTSSQVDAALLVRVEQLRGVEVSEQGTLASVGSRKQQRFLALWSREAWAFRVRALHLENGVPTSDEFRGDLEHLGPSTELLLTPQAWATENGVLTSRARVGIGSATFALSGTWQHGFPHVLAPTDTPALMSDLSKHRPSGVTALDVSGRLTDGVTVRQFRRWETLAPLLFKVTSRLTVDSSDGVTAKGWVVTDRPIPDTSHPYVGWLSDHVANVPAPSISTIQGSVRIPDYNVGEDQTTTNPWFMRPGDAASPHSYALNIERLKAIDLASTTQCDDRQREVPVFLADDSVELQVGESSTGFTLALNGPAGAAALEMIAWEVDDWQDSPLLDRSDAMIVKLDSGMPERLAFASSTTVAAPPGKRPTSSSLLTISTTGDTNTTNGPALGMGTFRRNQLDTGANPWAPVVTTIDATLSDAPGFVRLTVDKFQSIAKYPDGTISNIDTPGFDSVGAFDDNHSSTSQTRAWASGPLAGRLTITSIDFRRSGSTKPSPWQPPPSYDLSMFEVQITATPTGPVDLSVAPFALLTGKAGPAGKEAVPGLGLFVGCNQLVVDGKITTAARYGVGYASNAAPPKIALTDDPAVLTLTNFAGKLTVQKRDDDLADEIVILVATVAALLSSFWFAVFAVAVAELGFLHLLMKQSPIKVDDLCSGDWYLTPRPSTDLSVLAPFVNGWGHNNDPYHWDLNASVWVILPAIGIGL